MYAGFLATRMQAEVMKHREEIESAFDRYPDSMFYWCFVDLVDSSNYRIAHGAKDGYVRAETFFALVSAVVAPCGELRVVKEIGDAVLLTSPEFQPVLESVLLMDQTAKQLADVAGTKGFPFEIRAGVDFGPAKRLARRHEDFVGTPIDRLSRLMGAPSKTSNIFVQEDAYQLAAEILAGYAPFLTVSEPKQLSAESTKQMLQDVFYRELVVDRVQLAESRDHFAPWKPPR